LSFCSRLSKSRFATKIDINSHKTKIISATDFSIPRHNRFRFLQSGCLKLNRHKLSTILCCSGSPKNPIKIHSGPYLLSSAHRATFPTVPQSLCLFSWRSCECAACRVRGRPPSVGKKGTADGHPYHGGRGHYSMA
jgi:hypothetical protein